MRQEGNKMNTLVYCVTTLNKVVHFGTHEEAFEAYEVSIKPKAVYELDVDNGTCKGINIDCNFHDLEFMQLQHKMRIRGYKIIS